MQNGSVRKILSPPKDGVISQESARKAVKEVVSNSNNDRESDKRQRPSNRRR